MWQAYYRHRFLKLIFLLFEVMHVHYQLNWLRSVRAAYYSGRAAIAFRKNSDYDAALGYLQRYYAYINRFNSEPFDAQKAATLDFEWWLIHRYPKRYAKSLEEGLAAAVAAQYNMKPTNFTKYASYRAQAMHVRDIAAWQTKTEPDWQKIETLLIQSYTALKKAITK